jgi:hypothetical protein
MVQPMALVPRPLASALFAPVRRELHQRNNCKCELRGQEHLTDTHQSCQTFRAVIGYWDHSGNDRDEARNGPSKPRFDVDGDEALQDNLTGEGPCEDGILTRGEQCD